MKLICEHHLMQTKFEVTGTIYLDMLFITQLTCTGQLNNK